MLCSGCGASSSDPETRGVLIRRVVIQPGKKSGALVPHPDAFTDGTEEKYICNECFLDTEAARLVGDYDQGHDIPPSDYEVPHAKRPMCGLPTAFPRWR